MTTRQQTLTHRELDAALAERLFGWTWTKERTHPYTSEGWWFWQTPDGRRLSQAHAAFSTTGDGMLLVLDAMIRRYWGLKIHLDIGPKGWRCLFKKVVPTTWAFDASLPRAVALAALAALDKGGA